MPSSLKSGHRRGEALFSRPTSPRASAKRPTKNTDTDEAGNSAALFLLHLARRVAGDDLGILLDFARAYSSMDVPEIALLVLHDALEADATCPACHFVLGSVYQDLLKPEEAIKAFAKAGELDPEHPLPWIAMGDTHMWAGKFVEALECYDVAAEMRQQHGCAHVGRAHSLYRLGRVDESAFAAGRAHEIADNCFITSYKLGLFRLIVEEDATAAIDCFERCIRLDKDDARSYFMLADVYAIRGDSNKASEYRAMAERMQHAPSPKLSEAWSREQERKRGHDSSAACSRPRS